MRREPSKLRHSDRATAAAFTLTELLIVIGIIVLMIGLAVPILGVLTGNRSIDGAQNIIQAALNDARMVAIAQQRDTGMLFFISPTSGRVNLAMVQASDPQSYDGSLVEIYLDLVADRDPIPITPGIMAQMIDNCQISANGSRLDDGYIGYTSDLPNSNLPITRNLFTRWYAPERGRADAPPGQALLYGGVILFDSRGHLVSRTYGFRISYPDPVNPKKSIWSEMGKFFYYTMPTNNAPPLDYIPGISGIGTNGVPPESKFGIVLFSQEQFISQGFTMNDTQRNGGGVSASGFGNYNATWRGTSVTESQEEAWIDQNCVPYLVNRYTGTLVRGE